jgi:hypothetical protein
MESRGVLLEMLNKVSCIHFKKKRGAILEFIDVDFFNRSADEFLAAVFGYLLNTIVVSASLVDGFGFFNSTTVASLAILSSVIAVIVV